VKVSTKLTSSFHSEGSPRYSGLFCCCREICSANYSSSYLHFISCIYNNKWPDGHWHVDSKRKYDETNCSNE